MKEETILEDKKEDYHLKVVLEDEDILWYMNGQPIMHTNQHDGPWKCYQIEHSGMSGKDNNILVGGLGFGYTSQQCTEFGTTTTVEILPSVVDMYNAVYPDFPLDIVVDDVCDYLKNTEKTFDYILFQLDFAGFDLGYRYCIDSNKQIYTEEFMKMVKDKLNPKGVFVTEGLTETDIESPVKIMFEKSGFSVEETRNEYWPMTEPEPLYHVQHTVWKCTK